ncbi:MAG: alkaline phosphatase [Mycobacteriales bacterium]|jgi:alkaline phosphatase D
MVEHDVDRRTFLTGAATLAGAAALTAATGALPAAASSRPSHPDGPGLFQLGVASGDPLRDAVILWTRLIRDPLDARALGSRAIEVEWQVAHDPRFRRLARHGVALARPELAHSVHVDARGLEPARDYFYRFRAGRQISPVGRTRTAPAPWADPRQLRLGVVNCQDFQNGYWPTYWGLADEDLDVVFHLGDYIYEYDPASAFPDRRHTTPDTPGLDQLRTLADYRNRHAQYKGDPALQASHAAFPWIATWDDHEVENNYANEIDEIDDTGAKHQDPAQFARQRAHAYQAYFEHMPIRAHYRLGSPDFRIYRRFDLGSLARVSVLDTRQYRTDQPGAFPGDLGLEQFGDGNAAGTLTGSAQERWLDGNLTRSRARWNVIAQQVMMSQTRFPNPTGATVPPSIVNLDQWDGYQPQRTRLLQFLAARQIANPVVLAGDIHSSWFSDLKLNFDDPASPTVAVEFTATSISSDFPAAFDGPIRAANPFFNPHVKYFDGQKHGYLRCTVDRHAWRTDLRVVDTIAVRDAPVRTAVSFAVEAGQPGLVTA